MKRTTRMLILTLLALSLLLAGCASAPKETLKIFFFYGEGCPHCAAARPIIEQIVRGNKGVELVPYEVYYDPAGNELFFAMAQAYNMEPQYVPTIFLADRYWEGFDPTTTETEIQNIIDGCLQSGCTDYSVEVYEAFLNK